jgi:hypothetical protein
VTAFKETTGNLNVPADVQDDLSPAEQAAAVALARDWNLNRADGILRLGPADFAGEARAVVAGVRSLIEAEAAGKALVAAASDIDTVIDALTITNGHNSTIKGLERAKAIVHARAERAAKAHFTARSSAPREN